MRITYCLAEDRTDEEVGLRIAIASLKRHEPDSQVVVYRPNASDEFRKWLQKYSNVQLRSYYPNGAASWDCKPYVLVELLEEGADYVVWLDSDVVVMRPCTALFSNIAEDQMIVAQERASQPHQGSYERTIGWNLPVGRSLPVTTNSAVLRVRDSHLPFLRHWKAILAGAQYQAFQRLLIPERPIYALSDQDVMCALLGSQEYQDISLHYLQTGRDIIHSGGALSYSSIERVKGLFHRIPYFVHGQGAKPWNLFGRDLNHPGWAWSFRRLSQEISPYFAAIKDYRRDAECPCPWMDYKTWYGSLFRGLGLGHYALCGLPLTLLAEAIRFSQKMREKGLQP